MNITDSPETIIFKPSQGEEEFRVVLDSKHDTVWIGEHIHNIYHERELDKKSTIRKFRIVQAEGNREVERQIAAYNPEGNILSFTS